MAFRFTRARNAFAPSLWLAISVSLALVCLIACQSGADERSPAEWAKLARQVCHDDKKVKVQSISEMSTLIAAINKDDMACKSRFLSAIYELDPILKLPRDSLCEPRAFELLKDYHFRFIQPFKRANRRPTQFEPMPRDLVKEQLHPEPRKYTVEFDEHQQVLLAPIAFRHFFLKFALQVSGQCKKNLINNLQADAERILTDTDREVMQMFERHSPIGQALAGGIEKMDFDSVLHIPELDGRLTKSSGEEVLAEGREQHLKTSAHENSALFQMIYACKHRFKPLYEQLIMPVVRISKLGYDYQGEAGFSERERHFLKGDLMKNWLVVVHVCEIFKNTHLVRADPRPRPVAAAEQKSLREHLDELEASEEGRPGQQQQQEAPAESEDGKLSAMNEAEVRESEQRRALETDWLAKFKPIEYEPTVRNELADRLTIDTERQLDDELARKYGAISSNGFFRLLRKTSSLLKRMLSKLDLERFAHYRHNSLFYSGLLNFLSGCSNVASITMTISAMVSAG